MAQNLVDSLKKLDVKNDNHWTADGLPRLDTVKMLAADQTVTRDQVAAAAPGFSRDSAATWAPVATQEPVQGVTPAEKEIAPVTAVAPATQETPAPVKDEEVKVEAGDKDIDLLKTAFLEQTKKVESLRQAKEKLNSEFEAERQKEDDMRAELEAKNPNVDNTPNAIQGYLAAQNKLLQERAAKKQILKESGIDFKELQSGLRAPIDSVMSRKNSRGTKRPGTNQ